MYLLCYIIIYYPCIIHVYQCFILIPSCFIPSWLPSVSSCAALLDSAMREPAFLAEFRACNPSCNVKGMVNMMKNDGKFDEKHDEKWLMNDGKHDEKWWIHVATCVYLFHSNSNVLRRNRFQCLQYSLSAQWLCTNNSSKRQNATKQTCLELRHVRAAAGSMGASGIVRLRDIDGKRYGKSVCGCRTMLKHVGTWICLANHTRWDRLPNSLWFVMLKSCREVH